MLQRHDSLERQRERRVRQRVARRVARSLRSQVDSLRRLLVFAFLLASVGLGLALYLGLRPAPEPEAVVLCRGQAGVMRPGRLAADSTHRPSESAEERGREIAGGEASYYGDELRGNPTASGEAFDPEGLTAAHRSLPLGSRLRVTNLRNDRSVVVRVNDRGPFAGHRVIDVSKGAARALGMLGRGTARVRIELLPS